MFDFQELQIWQRSHALAVEINSVLSGRSRFGPPGLVAQLLRASASIPANIAEGAGQHSPAQTARFLDIAIGSASETENHIAFALAAKLLPRDIAARFTAEIRALRRMINSFKRWVLRNDAL